MACTITAEEFKEYFDRGQFDYGTDIPSIRDKDIEQAIAEAEAALNFDLFPDDETCKQAKYYATAHFLYSDTDAVETDALPAFNKTSHSADGVSESFQIPEWMTGPVYGFYGTTYYGQKFLMLAKPYLDGAVYSVPGATQP